MSKNYPSQKPDKRSRLDLDLFLLTLIKEGVNTPYLMLRSAGLSPGATLPALGRLETAGLVRRGKMGSRRRSDYSITSPGLRRLKSDRQLLQKRTAGGDMENVLRTAAIALVSGTPAVDVVHYLRAAASERAAEAKRHEAGIPATPQSLVRAADLYIWMRGKHAGSRLASETRVLRKIATQIKAREKKGS